MSESADVLIENCSRLLFPGDGKEEGIENASVAIRDGRISAVGPASELASLDASRRIDGTGRLLTPGFVDSHTHLVFAGDRSGEFIMRGQGADYEAIAAAGGGIRASVRATRQASEDELFALALPRVERMLAGGTTTIEIKSGYGLDLETELRMLRVIRRLGEATPVRVVATFLGAHEIPDEHRADRDTFIAEVCDRMIPAVAEEGLATFCDVFCERGVFTPEESVRILERGREAGLKPKIHADELAASGGSEVAAQVGAVSADHLMEITDAGIEGLKETGVIPTLLPGTTFYLGKERYAPARRLLEAGLPVAIATDRNPGSCTLESMQFMVGLSCLRLGMTPEEALAGATVNGARALGIEQEVGRIAPGLGADLVLWDVSEPAQIAYELGNAIPRTVFVAGEVVSEGAPGKPRDA